MTEKLVLAEIISEIIGIGKDKAIEILNSSSTSYSQPHSGATWVTSVNGSWGSYEGQILSAYFHPTKTHTASTEGKLGVKRSTA